MDRKTMVKNKIDEFGQRVIITIPSQDNKIIETNAFIQPLRQINKSYQWNNYLDSGFIDLSSYIYIGPYDIRLDNFPGDTILESDSRKYIVKKTDTVSIKNEVIYIWAILQMYTESNTDVLS